MTIIQKYLNPWKSKKDKLVFFTHMGKVLYSGKDGDQVIYNQSGSYDYVINDIAVAQVTHFSLDGREAVIVFKAIHLQLQGHRKVSKDANHCRIAKRAAESYLKGEKLLKVSHVNRP